MDQKRTCMGECKKYRVKKPSKGGRYEAGQALCQICSIWIDHRGAHLRDGEPANKGTGGWYCNCCNYKVRQNPRNIKYKSRLRELGGRGTEDGGHIIEGEIDLTYFNKRRGEMARIMIESMPENKRDLDMDAVKALLDKNNMNPRSIESEFNGSIDLITELVYTLKPPNKLSMVMEFHRIKTALGYVPKESDMKKHSKIRLSEYEAEFDSWGHFLDRLGYDPFYRDSKVA